MNKQVSENMNGNENKKNKSENGCRSVGLRLDRQDLKAWQEFKKYVENKHGKLYGVMGKELGEAMRLYLGKQEKTRLEIREDDMPAIRKDIDDVIMHSDVKPDKFSKRFEALYFKVFLPLLKNNKK